MNYSNHVAHYKTLAISWKSPRFTALHNCSNLCCNTLKCGHVLGSYCSLLYICGLKKEANFWNMKLMHIICFAGHYLAPGPWFGQQGSVCVYSIWFIFFRNIFVFPYVFGPSSGAAVVQAPSQLDVDMGSSPEAWYFTSVCQYPRAPRWCCSILFSTQQCWYSSAWYEHLQPICRCGIPYWGLFYTVRVVRSVDVLLIKHALSKDTCQRPLCPPTLVIVRTLNFLHIFCSRLRLEGCVIHLFKTKILKSVFDKQTTV